MMGWIPRSYGMPWVSSVTEVSVLLALNPVRPDSESHAHGR